MQRGRKNKSNDKCHCAPHDVRLERDDAFVVECIHRQVGLVIAIVCLLERINRKGGGEEVEGVGVIKDQELKLEEIEATCTLGGAGRYYAAVIYTNTSVSRM